MVKKVVVRNGRFITIILIVSAIICALFYKEIIIASFDKEPNTILNQIRTRQELRVGMLRSLTTLYIDYRNPNQVGGFEHALLEKFAESLNVKLRVIFANNLAELIEKNKEGKIDFIAAEIKGYSLEKNHFTMSKPYHYFTPQLIYRKGSTKPYSLSDIVGNLTIPKDSFQSYILNNIQQDFPNLVWEESSILNQEELLSLVEDQKIDYTIVDNRTITVMQRIYPLLTVAFDVIDEQPGAWYFPNSQDKSLLNRANYFINNALNNGTVSKLEYRYFSYMDQFDYVDTRAFIRAIDNVLPDYQPYFEKYAQEHKMDWKLLAAMAYQESHWNPKAISSTGVRGMMMLTKSTAESLGVTNRLDTEQSIKGGSAYLGKIISRMSKSIPKEERVWFALAAYNMGIAHLLDARELATKLDKNPNSWQDVRQILPLLSEEEYFSELKYGFARGYQAIHFVDSIQQYYISLVGYLLEKEHRQKDIDEKTYSLSLN